jgi:putative DNA primase/helicase
MPESLPKTNQAQALLFLSSHATPFCSKDGQPCASLPESVEHRTVVPLRSAAFRDWLTAIFYKEFQTAPSVTAFRAALRTLEARARYEDFPTQRVNHRLGFEGDPFLPSKILLDLANPAGEVLEITSRGWHIGNNLKAAFRQSTTTLPLPRPQQPPATSHQLLEARSAVPPAPSHQPPAALSEWAKLFHLSAPQYATALAWLTTALRPVGPYPILVLNGPAGSGKSVLARALRTLIDPSAAPVHRLPPRDRDLCQLALHNWILVFDLVQRVPYRISETLCALSSGDAIEITQPDLRDPLVFEVARPIILISPHDETQRAWTPPRTLANRTLTIQLQHIALPRPEAAIWSTFETLRPAVLAALSDAVATALFRIRDIDLGNVPRFPDCATWTAAAAPALGLDEAAVINAFADPNSVWAGSDPLREAIHELLRSTGAWTGEATDLLNQLRARVPLAALPSTPKGLSQALPSISGIHVTRTRDDHGRRILGLTRVLDASQKKAAGNPRPTLATL